MSSTVVVIKKGWGPLGVMISVGIAYAAGRMIEKRNSSNTKRERD